MFFLQLKYIFCSVLVFCSKTYEALYVTNIFNLSKLGDTIYFEKLLLQSYICKKHHFQSMNLSIYNKNHDL